MNKNKDLEIFGENLRMARLKEKISQERLVEILGALNAPHVGKIEKGEVDIRISTLFAILRALNLKLEDLIDLSK